MQFKILIIGIVLGITVISCTSKNESGKETTNEENQSTSNDIKPTHLDKESFIKLIWNFETTPDQWVYNSTTPSVIDFYADWCKPCKMVAPIMEELAREYKGKVNIYKINVDEQKEIAGIFGIQSIPTVFFIPVNGKPIFQPGALSKQDYKKIIDENLLSSGSTAK